MSQLTPTCLFTGRERTRRAFDAFHAQHPEVYDLFARFAHELRYAGRTRYSARTIVERIRWHYAVNPDHDGGFKINDWFSAHYGRLLVQREPDFAGMFEMRGEP
jgi:hypothetical protein